MSTENMNIVIYLEMAYMYACNGHIHHCAIREDVTN